MESQIPKINAIELGTGESQIVEKKKVTYESQLSFQTSDSLGNESSLDPHPVKK